MLKKSGKKVLSMMLAVMLVVSMTACGNNTDSQKDGKIEITYWHIFPEGDAFKEVHDKLVKDFNESQDEVYVNDLGISFFDFLSKMDTAIPAGTSPDVAFMGMEDNNFRASSGVLADLKPLIDKNGIDISQYYDAALNQVTYKDGIYSMPMIWGTRNLVYNKQMFRDAGLDPEKPPKTIEELEEYADKLTVLDEKGNIKVMGFHPSLGNASFIDYLDGRGGELFDENQNPIINNDKVLETLEWYVDMTNKYGAKQAQSLQSSSKTTGIDPLLAGYVAMEVNVNDFYKKLSESDIDFGMSPVPIPENGGVRSATGGGFGLEVFDHGDPAKVEAAFKFVSFMTNVENQQYWAVENKWPVANQKAMESSEEIKNDPNWQVIVGELPYGKPNYYIEKAKNWWNALAPEIEAAQNGLKTPKQALDDAQKAVESEISSYESTN